MADVLVVYVPGLTEGREVSAPLLKRVRAELGLAEADTWVYPHPVRLWSRRPLVGHARKLSESIQQYWEDYRNSPQRIVLIGHSMGGLLVRHAYLLARGELGGQQRSWAGHVSRIVLLATPNRGWDVNRHGWWGRVFLWLTRPLTGGLAVRDAIKGSPFVTDLRLAWLREVGALGPAAPLTVQVRSGDDALVEEEDSRDVEVLPQGVQLVVPLASHNDVPCVDVPPEREHFPNQRWVLLKKAIIDDIAPTTPEPLPELEQRYKSVVFLLHGIRARNDLWVEKLRDDLAGDPTVRVETASYGRFSAYNFALPITRRRKLRWFLDQYSYLLARHPQLPFHFVGHSNGTYMLGQALKNVSSIRFERVYLAGSVLPVDFDWRAADRQVGSLVNVCAAADRPVAWLCSALRGVGMRDIGTGGFEGFQQLPAAARQFRYLPGGHGAALVTNRLAGVAQFVRTGEPVAPQDLLEAPGGGFSLVSRMAPGATLVLAVLWGAAAVTLALVNPVGLAGLVLGTLLIALVLMVA